MDAREIKCCDLALGNDPIAHVGELQLIDPPAAIVTRCGSSDLASRSASWACTAN